MKDNQAKSRHHCILPRIPPNIKVEEEEKKEKRKEEKKIREICHIRPRVDRDIR